LNFTPKAFANSNPSALTPKALANFSPGFEHRENPGLLHRKIAQTLKGFGNWRTLSAFLFLYQSRTQGCRYAPTAGLKLANAFGVNAPGLKLANAFGVNSNSLI
jgi:hypothetical protein